MSEFGVVLIGVDGGVMCDTNPAVVVIDTLGGRDDRFERGLDV